MNYKLITELKFDGIDYQDAPDYCDAYIVSGKYDGVELTQEQIDELNEDTDFIHEQLMDYLF